jgi:O-succinylbenzoic acid--CoA ligase
VAGTGTVRLRERDLVAVTIAPGPEWPAVVAGVRHAGAALLPLDHRLRTTLLEAAIRRARPTVLRTPEGWSRRQAGVPVDEGVALVISTSGTAGAPKLVEFDGGAVDAAVSGSLAVLGATHSDPWLSCLPLAHVGGLLVVLRAAALGAPLRVLPRFDLGSIARAAEARFTSVVPTMLLRVLDAGLDLSGYRAILVGAGAMSPELRQRAEGGRAPIVQTYGLTESCGGVVYDGRPFPGVGLRIDPATSGIELRGPTLMRGYRLDPDGTAEALGPDGWLRTADAGRLDPDGTLQVLGRLDDLIKTGGERVWPQEVEAALRGIPGIAEVAVAGRPDREWGQRVVAFVVPVEGNEPPDLGRLREHAADRLPGHALPRELVVLSEPLPRSASGKVRRNALLGAPRAE